jgi:hypothetical protein
VSHVSETAELDILYNGHLISNGEELAPSQAADEPDVVIKGSDTYTLLMVVSVTHHVVITGSLA